MLSVTSISIHLLLGLDIVIKTKDNIQACKLARKCTDREVCDVFRGYFDVQEHETKTKNNQCLLKLTRIQTEYAPKSFRFMGAKI